MTDRIMDAKVWDGSAWQPTVYGPGYAQCQTIIKGTTGDASDPFATVTNGSPAHTKGAWSEVFASIPFEADFLMLGPRNGTSGQATAMLIDLAVGAAGAEVIVLENYPAGSLRSTNQQSIPGVTIPAGSRVSIRSQGVYAGRVLTVDFGLARMGWLSSPEVVAYGVSTATSRGTAIAAGSGWTEIVAATPEDYLWVRLAPSASLAAQVNAVGTSDLAIGAAGSEVQVATMNTRSTSSETLDLNNSAEVALVTGVYGPVPAGSRLSVRCSIANVDLALLCGKMP